MMEFIAIMVVCWLWIVVGMILLIHQKPTLDNGLQAIARMAAWPWFLFKE